MQMLINPLLELLYELYIGTDNEASWVIDADPGHGFSTAIETLTADEASTPLVPGGSTIAAHTEHLRWSLEYALVFYKGQQPSWDWNESWKIRTVSEPEWKKLQQDLLEAYHQIKEVVSGVSDWSNPLLLKGTLALAPHAAYHLGAVKQLMIVMRKRQPA